MSQRKTSLHDLPRFDDKLTYLYIEHAVVEQRSTAIAAHRADGSVVEIPAAALSVLFLGPGTSLTHAAIKTLADNNCQVLWVGEHGVRFYGQGLGGARSSRNLLKQAFLSTNDTARLQVVVRMYCMRFNEMPPNDITLQQLRGKEGVRMRQAYADAAKESGVEWTGRQYNTKKWSASNPINRALSAANACLYGLCHAAILSGGYSPALGFVHTGKQLSFVYDVADLYKASHAIPVAFAEAAKGGEDIESRVRRRCRDKFRESKLVEQILPDIAKALDIAKEATAVEGAEDDGLPEDWWQPKGLSAEIPIGKILELATKLPW